MSKRLLVLALLLAGCGSSEPPRRQQEARERAGELRTLSSTRQFAGEKSLLAEIEFGAGTLAITPADAGTLYRTELRYNEAQLKPQLSYADGHFRLGMEGSHVKGGKGRDHLDNQLALQFGPDAPLSLDLKFGAGRATAELGGLNVASLQVATGASESRLTFSKPTAGTCERVQLQAGAARMDVQGLGNLSPRTLELQGGVGDVRLDFSGPWRNDVSAKMSMGIGALHLVVPRNVGVRVHKNSMLASFDAPELDKQGDFFVSRGYQSATRHIDIDIDAAFGSIRLAWADGAAHDGSF